MIFKFCTFTDKGLARDNNEDAAVIDEATGLVVLADGMGGYNAGEIASGMATEFIRTEMSRWLSEAGKLIKIREVRRAMEICVDNANRAVFNAAKANSHYSGMGTTLVMGVFFDTKLLVGHIGDSRCYRLRDEAFEQITKDHSLLQEQIDAGLLTVEQAATSANRNLVTRALGVEDVTELDITEHEMLPGDLYLMCSDGLSDMVSDGDIAKILRTPGTLEQISKSLIAAANGNGGRDNITVLLAKVEAEDEKRSLISRLLRK